MIKRVRGKYTGRNKSSKYKDLVFTVATSSDLSLDIEGQTKLTLETIENNLNELNSNKEQILSAQVFIANIRRSYMPASVSDSAGPPPEGGARRDDRSRIIDALNRYSYLGSFRMSLLASENSQEQYVQLA